MSEYKKGLMTQFPYARGRKFVCKNIGDYVQTVATRQFIDPIDEYIEQEEASNYFPEDGKPIKLVMNGWFQWRSENWPPSPYIKPLLISMHISPLKADSLLTPEGIRFLKENGPVGCRDYYTMNLLESKGIPSYFSACMTLTLGKKYRCKDEERVDRVCIVDPFFEIPDIFEKIDDKKVLHIRRLIMGACAFLAHPITVCRLTKNTFFRDYLPTGFLDRSKSKVRPLYKAALFYKTYRKKFSRKLLLNAEYITHWMDVNMDGSVCNDDLIFRAEELVRKYASSKMVITSRIHAALPCLGVETPVIFIANEAITAENSSFNTPGRLGGLIDLFRVYTLKKGRFFSDDQVLNDLKIIEPNTKFGNKDDWKKFAVELEKKVNDFMRD